MPSILPRLTELVARGENLPALPTLLLQLHHVLQDERAGAWHVAEVIERDPALTVRLLRAANSAAFTRGQPVTSVAAAVSRLGREHVRTICVVHAVADAFGAGRGQLDARAFWLHSATVAALVSNLWVRVGDTASVSADEAYVVGLLHDVGLLVLDRHFPESFSRVLAARIDSDAPLTLLEQQHCGVDHGAIGGLLIGRWSMPAYVSEAIAHHDEPEAAPLAARTMATVIAAAEGMCWQMDLGLLIEGRPVELPAVLLRRLGVPASDVRAIIDATADVHAFAESFLAPGAASSAAA
jgi:HD-like signal output (HDOD) protein